MPDFQIPSLSEFGDLGEQIRDEFLGRLSGTVVNPLQQQMVARAGATYARAVATLGIADAQLTEDQRAELVFQRDGSLAIGTTLVVANVIAADNAWKTTLLQFADKAVQIGLAILISQIPGVTVAKGVVAGVRAATDNA